MRNTEISALYGKKQGVKKTNINVKKNGWPNDPSVKNHLSATVKRKDEAFEAPAGKESCNRTLHSLRVCVDADTDTDADVDVDADVYIQNWFPFKLIPRVSNPNLTKQTKQGEEMKKINGIQVSLNEICPLMQFVIFHLPFPPSATAILFQSK